MEDRLSGVQEVLDGFRKKLDDIHKALHEQKQYDMGVKMDSMKAELQGQIDRIARDVQALQGRSSAPGAPASPAPIKPA
jgi:hypothetical protein